MERELASGHLDAWMEQAVEGRRQVAFITGETGIGKTTVVETFVERASAAAGRFVARGPVSGTLRRR